LSLTRKRPLFPRRTLIAAAPALALGVVFGNRAGAQPADDGLADASTGWQTFPPINPPALTFEDGSGKNLSFADYKGHVLLVNIWATWCAPCKEELPGFAALAPKLKPFGGLVLPISIDVTGTGAVEAYFKAHKITTLPVLADPSGQALDRLQTNGIPVTFIVNPAGKMVARLDGAAAWDTPGVIAFLRRLAGKDEPNQDGFMQS